MLCLDDLGWLSITDDRLQTISGIDSGDRSNSPGREGSLAHNGLQYQATETTSLKPASRRSAPRPAKFAPFWGPLPDPLSSLKTNYRRPSTMMT